MTVYSNPYKIVLIYVRTMFAQSSCRLLVSEIAYGKFNYTVILARRFAASANLAPHQSAQVIMEHGMWIFSFLSDQIFGSVHSAFFPVFDSICDLFPDSAQKKCEGLVSTIIRQQAAKHPCVPSGGPWCVSCEVSRFMDDTCHTPRSSEPGRKIFVGAHPIYYLIAVFG